MDKIRIIYNDVDGEPMWISKRWYSEDNVAEMWTTDPDLAKVWDLNITTLGSILSAVLQTYNNEHPVNTPLNQRNIDHHLSNLLSLLGSCRVERIKRTMHYKVIQSF